MPADLTGCQVRVTDAFPILTGPEVTWEEEAHRGMVGTVTKGAHGFIYVQLECDLPGCVVGYEHLFSPNELEVLP